MAGKPRKELTEVEKAAKAKEQNDKFKALVHQRLPKLQAQLGLIGNLASYKPTETQVEWLFKQIAESAAQAHGRFQGTTKAASNLEIPD